MNFDIQKRNILKKMVDNDLSRKGIIDEDIKDLLDLINSKNDYCTTSSCSGRIVLIDLRARLKSENEWLLSKHSSITIDEFDESLKKEKKGIVWLKQEPVILHTMCRDINSVKKLISILQKVGFKQMGVISLTRNIVEVMGSENMSVPIFDSFSDDMLIDNKYKKFLVTEANRKLIESKKKIELLFDEFSKIK